MNQRSTLQQRFKELTLLFEPSIFVIHRILSSSLLRSILGLVASCLKKLDCIFDPLSSCPLFFLCLLQRSPLSSCLLLFLCLLLCRPLTSCLLIFLCLLLRSPLKSCLRFILCLLLRSPLR